MPHIRDEVVAAGVSGGDAPHAYDDRIRHGDGDDEEDWGQGVSPCEQQPGLWVQFLVHLF
jgi:hypothetical protein